MRLSTLLLALIIAAAGCADDPTTAQEPASPSLDSAGLSREDVVQLGRDPVEIAWDKASLLGTPPRDCGLVHDLDRAIMMMVRQRDEWDMSRDPWKTDQLIYEIKVARRDRSGSCDLDPEATAGLKGL